MLSGPTALGQSSWKFVFFIFFYAISLLGAKLGTGVTVWHHYWHRFEFSTGLGWHYVWPERESEGIFGSPGSFMLWRLCSILTTEGWDKDNATYVNWDGLGPRAQTSFLVHSAHIPHYSAAPKQWDWCTNLTKMPVQNTAKSWKGNESRGYTSESWKIYLCKKGLKWLW